MPELPEVEHLRRTLASRLIGRAVTRVRVSRRDVIARPTDPPAGFARSGAAPSSPTVPSRELLSRQRIAAIHRHGKQLAITTDAGRAIAIHLGMSGTLLHLAPRTRTPHADHVHVAWSLDDASRLLFRDPRRFGGIWTFPSLAALRNTRWDTLGPDALTITPRALHARLERTTRPLKAALLDQTLIAGIGNIYADEALFRARIHPARPAHTLTPDDATRLARSLRTILARAIDAGGSTLRDYTDAGGDPGAFQRLHKAYARAGLPCTRCGEPLSQALIAQRTTVWCPRCQGPLSPPVVHTPGGHAAPHRSLSLCE